ncbi:MAG: hypothetical protein AABX02_03450 [archaeon]
MHALEWILCLTALMGALGLLMSGINEHEDHWNKTQLNWEKKRVKLGCSSNWDAVNSHYVISPTGKCTDFPFALHEHDGIFLLMGMDSNHYE